MSDEMIQNDAIRRTLDGGRKPSDDASRDPSDAAPKRIDRPAACPMYRKIADAVHADIVSGKYKNEERLPSIRRMAAMYNVSVGTIRQVYDLLNREGVVVSRRGKGTFVAADLKDEPFDSRKSRAMAAIDTLLETMAELGFSMREARIFFELRLRQKEDEHRAVRVALVAATPEERAVMDRAFEKESSAQRFLLSYEDVRESPDRLNGGYDFLMVPADLYGEMSAAVPNETTVMPVVLRPSSETLAACLSVKKGERVGFLTASSGFLAAMKRAIFPALPEDVVLTDRLWRDPDDADFLASLDCLVLGPEAADFATPAALARVRDYASRGLRVIRSHFECDQGSMIYVRRAVEKRDRELRN